MIINNCQQQMNDVARERRIADHETLEGKGVTWAIPFLVT